MGVRAGAVVACSIPLVLAAVFVGMELTGIDLQRVSLGALIIALGLLVDDAMITVEMMVAQLEAGVEKEKAATFAYTSTAFPMLTGTLVTVAGFVPIGFAKSSAGEYTFSLFAVVALALLLSWIVAVLFAPLIGVTILVFAGLLSIETLWLAFVPAGVYVLIHVVEGETITPMLLAKRFTINPVLVILALVFWYWMWGILGAILAVPMLAIAKIVCDRVQPLASFGHFIEG